MPKKPVGGFVTVDPAVAALLADGEHRQATRAMSKDQRRQAERNRITLDISKDTQAMLVDLATQLSVPISQLAEYLILKGMEVTSTDELSDMRTPSRSMRYEFNLIARQGATKGHHKGCH